MIFKWVVTGFVLDALALLALDAGLYAWGFRSIFLAVWCLAAGFVTTAWLVHVIVLPLLFCVRQTTAQLTLLGLRSIMFVFLSTGVMPLAAVFIMAPFLFPFFLVGLGAGIGVLAHGLRGSLFDDLGQAFPEPGVASDALGGAAAGGIMAIGIVVVLSWPGTHHADPGLLAVLIGTVSLLPHAFMTGLEILEPVG